MAKRPARYDKATAGNTNQAPQRWPQTWRAKQEGTDDDNHQRQAACSASKPAAVTKLAPWPTQQKVKDLAADADRYYRLLEEVVKVSEKLSEANDYTRKQIIEQARKVQKRLEADKPQVQGHAKRMGRMLPRKLVVNPKKAIALSTAK